MVVEDIIDEINAYLKNSFDSEAKKNTLGLYSGMSGLLLYASYYGLYTNGREFLNETEQDLLVSRSFNNSISSSEFSEGLSGNLWVFLNLYNNNLIDIDLDELSMYKEHLYKQLIKYAKEKEWDNLHGAFGILYFLTEAHFIDESQLDDFLELVREGMYDNSLFVFYLFMGDSDLVEKNFNLSLSHGISGHILILTKLLKQFPENKTLGSILKDMVSFLLQFKTQKLSKGYFPQTVPIHKKNIEYNNFRLAWCYGDIGSGLALYRYSEAIKDMDLRQEATRVLLHSSQKRGMNDCMIYDAPLCHGTAGAMHLFDRLYFETKNREFKTASDHWLEQTILLYKQNGINGLGSLRAWNSPDRHFKLSPCMLYGVSGIGLALLAKTYPDIEPTWDGCLFLS